MRDYEVVYIFQSALTPEDIEGKLESYHANLTTGSGQVTAVEHWGRRQLAYPIRKETNGYYVVAQFTAGPELLPELESALKLDEHLLRHLIVLSEGELPVAPSKRLEADEDRRAGDPSHAGEPSLAEAQTEADETPAEVTETPAETTEAQTEADDVEADAAEVQVGGSETQAEAATAGAGEDEEEKEEG